MNPRWFVVALFVLGCVGCASQKKVLDRDYRFEGRPGHGLIILSTRFVHDCTRGEKPAASLDIFGGFYRKRRDGTGVSGNGWSVLLNRAPGDLVVMELEAGPQEFRWLDVYLMNSMRKWVSIPFKVEPGKATYLGEVTGELSNCSGFPSIALRVKDAWERDSTLFQERMKSLRSEDVVKQLLPSWPPPQAGR